MIAGYRGRDKAAVSWRAAGGEAGTRLPRCVAESAPDRAAAREGRPARPP